MSSVCRQRSAGSLAPKPMDSPILEAVQRGDLISVEFLLSDPRLTADDINECIVVGCQAGHSDILRLLMAEKRVTPIDAQPELDVIRLSDLSPESREAVDEAWTKIAARTEPEFFASERKLWLSFQDDCVKYASDPVAARCLRCAFEFRGKATQHKSGAYRVCIRCDVTNRPNVYNPRLRELVAHYGIDIDIDRVKPLKLDVVYLSELSSEKRDDTDKTWRFLKRVWTAERAKSDRDWWAKFEGLRHQHKDEPVVEICKACKTGYPEQMKSYLCESLGVCTACDFSSQPCAHSPRNSALVAHYDIDLDLGLR